MSNPLLPGVMTTSALMKTLGVKSRSTLTNWAEKDPTFAACYRSRGLWWIQKLKAAGYLTEKA